MFHLELQFQVPQFQQSFLLQLCLYRMGALQFHLQVGWPLTPFVSTFTPVSTITVFSWASCLAPILLPACSSPQASVFFGIPFATGIRKGIQDWPAHAAILNKLVSKITGGHFVDLANLLSANLCRVDNEPQHVMDRKLVTSTTKQRQVEVEDIFRLKWSCTLRILNAGWT